MARGKKTDSKGNSKAASGNVSRFSAANREGENADYGGIDGNVIRAAIESVTALGGAIRFGYTTDGGAYAVGIYDGDDRFTEYFRSDDALVQYLQHLSNYE